MVSPLAFTGMTNPQQFGAVGADGWISVNDEWYLVDAAPTDYKELTFTCNANAADRYWIGEKVAYQVAKYGDTTFYGYITGLSDTQLYIRGNDADAATLHDDPNHRYAGICTNVTVSHAAVPLGFPSYFLFTPTVTSTAGASPTFSTALGSFYLEGGVVFSYEYLVTATVGGGVWKFFPPIETKSGSGMMGNAMYETPAPGIRAVGVTANVAEHSLAYVMDSTTTTNVATGVQNTWPSTIAADAILFLTFNNWIDRTRTVA